ncbi:MAG: hypothetical protein VX589_00535 [Myxococcota bacterium]|nr:hypothetical protein [Myxococcota bacterium]
MNRSTRRSCAGYIPFVALVGLWGMACTHGGINDSAVAQNGNGMGDAAETSNTSGFAGSMREAVQRSDQMVGVDIRSHDDVTHESQAGGEKRPEPQDDTQSDEANPVFTHKMMKATGENRFASLAYECAECTFEQHLSIVPPEGWSKGPTQVAVFTSGELRSTPMFDGVPNAVDFLPEMPGKEYILIAKNVSARLVERSLTGVVVIAQVIRDTVFRYAAGRRIHELTSPDGDIFVLFAYHVDPTNVVIPDFNDEAALGNFQAPQGWTYGTRILNAELRLESTDVATVLAIRGAKNSTWQRRP